MRLARHRYIWILRTSFVAFVMFFHSAATHSQNFRFAAIGDMPYGSTVPFQQLINRLNTEDPAFTIHVGDIKSGSTACSDDIFNTVKNLFNLFEQPLIYTPGDNEWTDCHRESNGKMDPLERLSFIRSMFFPDEYSLGINRILLKSQSHQLAYKEFTENRSWSHNGVTFATLHLVGSNNNLQRNSQSANEFFRRDDANRLWLSNTFLEAKNRSDIAVVLAMQADTMFEKHPYERTGFNAWLAALEVEAKAWGKPILLIQGDSHEFKIDQPMFDSDKKKIANVTRLVVHGDKNINATLVEVNVKRPEQPFAFFVLMATDVN